MHVALLNVGDPLSSVRFVSTRPTLTRLDRTSRQYEWFDREGREEGHKPRPRGLAARVRTVRVGPMLCQD